MYVYAYMCMYVCVCLNQYSEHVACIDCKVIVEFSRESSVTQLHSNVNKTKVLKSFSHTVLVRPWKLDMAGLIGSWKCQRGVCVGADKPPMHFSSAHLSFLVIIITLLRLSVSHTFAEEWKSKQAGHDHLIPFVSSCSLRLSIVHGHRYG